MFLPVWAKNDNKQNKNKQKINNKTNKKNKKKNNYIQYMKNCEGMTSSTRSFEYS